MSDGRWSAQAIDELFAELLNESGAGLLLLRDVDGAVVAPGDLDVEDVGELALVLSD